METLIAAAVVLLAAGYLAVKFRNKAKGKNAFEGCEGCRKSCRTFSDNECDIQNNDRNKKNEN